MINFMKVGVLWGGGLGDLLMIRPFLKALHANVEIDSYLLTSATHATELFEEFCKPTKVIILHREPRNILNDIRKWRCFFDLIYIGPYPTFKTKLLGYLLAPKKLWSQYNSHVPAFILEQIISDIGTLGLTVSNDNRDFPSFLPWKVLDNVNPFPEGQPFIVLHTGAKERWETTLWPNEKWKQLIERILGEKNFSLCIVGTAGEANRITNITTSFSEENQQRIKICCSWPLKDIASLIASSAGVVCHNSGIFHLSTFLKKNTVCITGSSARYWRPDYSWITNVTSDTCKFACNRYRCPVPFFKAKCINWISVDDVWKKIIDNIYDKTT